jgi:serine/threonine-protein kinase
VTSTDVPNVLGLSEASAVAALENAGFVVSIEDQVVLDEGNDGKVIDQSPNGGQKADSGSTVTITVGSLPGD